MENLNINNTNEEKDVETPAPAQENETPKEEGMADWDEKKRNLETDGWRDQK